MTIFTADVGLDMLSILMVSLLIDIVMPWSHFSLWGNYNELYEVIELAKQGKISHSIQEFPLSEINNVVDMLKNGQIKGGAVIVPKQIVE
ncbi:MAG TPA: hypothetical protein VE692_03610 [Nitrososphaera sp.]|nr:hypothetical protein [Nitrososphaera sp.]